MTAQEALGSQWSNPKPYFPHRGSPEKRAQPTQGKLFQDPKPVAGHRYPRGYTPERMAEVRRETDDVVRHSQPGVSLGRKPISYSLTGSTLDSPYNVRQGKRLAQEAIARSNIPAEHLQGLQRIGLESGLRGTGFGLEDKLGSYAPAKREISIEPLRGSLEQERGRPARGLILDQAQLRRNKGLSRQQAQPIYDAALVHEIGHHVDFTRRRIAGSQERTKRALGSPTGRGKAEGEADRYMLNRFRNDPRNQRRTQFNPETQTYGAMGLLYKGYPTDLARRGKAATEISQAGEATQERTNRNRKAAASATRKALTRYRQSQKRRSSARR